MRTSEILFDCWFNGLSNKWEYATTNPLPLLLSTKSSFFICTYIATKNELHKSQLEEPVILAPFSVSYQSYQSWTDGMAIQSCVTLFIVTSMYVSVIFFVVLSLTYLLSYMSFILMPLNVYFFGFSYFISLLYLP